MQDSTRVWPDAGVHDTVRAVLRDAAYHRTLRQSLIDRFLIWLRELITRIGKYADHLPSSRTVGLGVIAIVVVYLLARTLIAARKDARHISMRSDDGTTRLLSDPWASAEALTRDQRYEDAAHELYRGVVASVVRDERMRADPSRTSGDYARELSRRSSRRLAPFRQFVRQFDVAVYGRAGCNVTTISELTALSRPFREMARAA